MTNNRRITGFVLSILLFWSVVFPDNLIAATTSGEDTTMPQSVSESNLSVSGDGIPSIPVIAENPEAEQPKSQEMDDQGESGEREIIKVMLPTEFETLMYKQPGGEELQIESQDILFINKSNIPVNVVIKEIQCEILEHTEDGLEEVNLNLSVREFQKEECMIPYIAKVFDPLYIGLDKAKADTNAEQLMKEAEGWNPIGEVRSGDYSIVRITGSLGKVDLGEKDVKLGLVFEFEKD